MKRPLALASFFLFSFGLCKAQKLHVTPDRTLLIETTIIISGVSSSEETFKLIKTECIEKISNYNDMLKGEVEPTLIKLLEIKTYWAAGRTRQQYSQDLKFKIEGNKVYISVDNLATYVEEKGKSAKEKVSEGTTWGSANKFFIKKDGTLRNYPQFYNDVTQQFVDFVNRLSKSK
jgi:hypothetical protein